jgi:hypothetical protein
MIIVDPPLAEMTASALWVCIDHEVIIPRQPHGAKSGVTASERELHTGASAGGHRDADR